MKSCPACALSYPDETTFCFLDGKTLSANEDPLVGTTVDGLVRLEARLANSGWSRSYHGRIRLVGQPCVVKLLTLPDGAEGTAEAAVMARRSSHHNVLPLFSVRVVGRTVVVVRPQVEAQPLALLLERARLDVSQAAGLTLQILAGLARLHDFGGVHGNLRPSNALYWSNGHLDLIDVALGRALVREPWEDQPESFAAQHYFAPELNNHHRTSVQADLFAAGIIAFELLTGSRPFGGDNVRVLRERLADESTDALYAALRHVPPPIVAWTLGMLARAPELRPESGQHALELLRAACTEAAIAPMLDPGRPEVPRAHELDRGLTRWERYRGIFATMLEVGFPGGPTEQARSGLSAIVERVDRLASLGKRASFELENHTSTTVRALSGRERLAAQISKATEGGEVIRKRIAAHKSEAFVCGERASEFKPRVLESHREVIQWEGRSGFTEPYQELATAYRNVADLITAWWEARQAQLEHNRGIEVEREKLRSIDGEVDEIRQSLRIHESNIGGELDAAEAALGALGNEADRIELELLDLASRFTAPLRSKPELGPQFSALTARE